MPHQCLNCGYAFDEGSSALLQGCPECKGTRFFYSNEAVDAAERKELASQAKDDLKSVVTQMLQDKAPKAMAALEESAGSDGWATLKPKDIRRLVKEAQAEQQMLQDEVVEQHEEANERAKRVDEMRARLEETMAQPTEEAPDTVTIREPGEYDIDVRGLLEKNPIVVHKDGAYMIHLPSLFE